MTNATFASLFSGEGGFDLGAIAAGMTHACRIIGNALELHSCLES